MIGRLVKICSFISNKFPGEERMTNHLHPASLHCTLKDVALLLSNLIQYAGLCFEVSILSLTKRFFPLK
jgi:hypothetical protein